jgi:hypothetical protein
MKRLAALALTAATVLLATNANADPPPKDLREPAVVTDEVGDAWLHDHCSFRGLVSPAIANIDVAGQVVEVLDDRSAKEFRCPVRPPFWQGSWTPAAPETVACTAPGTPHLCVVPLGSAPAAPSASFAASTAVTASASPAPAPKPKATAGSTLGWVLVGTGIMGLVTAGFAGGVVLDAKATTADHCDAWKTCDGTGLAAAERGKTASVVGTVAFAAGAAALTGGIVVLAVGKPREQQVRVVARPSTASASLGLEGRF